MLFHRLKIVGLLSFGPAGVDLPMGPLNVLIGPNGSGKTNFLEVIALFRACANGLDPVFTADGIGEWLWKGRRAGNAFILEADVEYGSGGKARHLMTVAVRNGKPIMKIEQLEPEVVCSDDEGLSYRRAPRDTWPPQFPGTQFAIDLRELGDAAARENMILIDTRQRPEASLLGVVNHIYPMVEKLKDRYERIGLYRYWSFSPTDQARQQQDAQAEADFLADEGTNLPVVLSRFHGDDKDRLVAALQKLFPGIVDLNCTGSGGNVLLFLVERGNRYIPATRLSDGTLRYLCLLSILLHPKPPPLVAIEEPELGLHPDLLPTVADLLVDASERTQLVVTTHSDILVDALTEKPESIVVCEKHDGQTAMRRLDRNDLSKWLKDYRLGELWTSGELGGNRW